MINLDITVPFSDIEDEVNGLLDSVVPTIDNGFVEWDYFTVTIENDSEGQITELRDGVLDAIRLLHTPQGSVLLIIPVHVETAASGLKNN